MKTFFFLFNCILACISTYSQQADTVAYLDEKFQPKSKEAAVYINSLFKTQNGYDYFINNLKTGNKARRGAIATNAPIIENTGTRVDYFENGTIKDSICYDEKGWENTHYRYYPSGQLYFRYDNTADGKKIEEAFDENGNKMTWFVFSLEAEYPGGKEAWKKMLERTLNPAVPINNSAPVGVYKAVVRFLVTADGSVQDVKPITHHGYGMEAELIRVIKKSGKWDPAIRYNEPVDSYKEQFVMFSISQSY